MNNSNGKPKQYYKHPQFGQVYGDNVATPAGRLVWPYLTEPREPGEPRPGWAPQPPKYEATILFDKGVPEVEAFIAYMTDESKAMLEVYNHKNNAKLADGLPVIRDGNDFDAEKYPYYVDRWVLTAKNQQVPKFVDQYAKQGKITAEDFKGGMSVKFAVVPMVTKGGWSYKLTSVQFLADDGARYGGGTRDVTSVFSAAAGEGNESSNDASKTSSEPPPVVEAAKPAPVAAPKKSGLDKAAMDRL